MLAAGAPWCGNSSVPAALPFRPATWVKLFASLPQEGHNCNYTCGLYGLEAVSSNMHFTYTNGTATVTIPVGSVCSRVVRNDGLYGHDHPVYPAGTVLHGARRACTRCQQQADACWLPRHRPPGHVRLARVPALPASRPPSPLRAPLAAGMWLWIDKAWRLPSYMVGCYVGTNVVRWPDAWTGDSSGDFSCSCAVPTQPLVWDVSEDCVAGARTATNGMGVCRVTVQDVYMPFSHPGVPGYTPGRERCDAPFLDMATSFNDTQLLCAGAG